MNLDVHTMHRTLIMMVNVTVSGLYSQLFFVYIMITYSIPAKYVLLCSEGLEMVTLEIMEGCAQAETNIFMTGKAYRFYLWSQTNQL